MSSETQPGSRGLRLRRYRPPAGVAGAPPSHAPVPGLTEPTFIHELDLGEPPPWSPGEHNEEHFVRAINWEGMPYQRQSQHTEIEMQREMYEHHSSHPSDRGMDLRVVRSVNVTISHRLTQQHRQYGGNDFGSHCARDLASTFTPQMGLRIWMERVSDMVVGDSSVLPMLSWNATLDYQDAFLYVWLTPALPGHSVRVHGTIVLLRTSGGMRSVTYTLRPDHTPADFSTLGKSMLKVSLMRQLVLAHYRV